MIKKIYLISTIIAFLLLIASFCGCIEDKKETSTTKSKTLYVDDDRTADYTNIQNAIDNASDGDTVFVYSGSYIDDYIDIDKSITLQGEDKATTIFISVEPAQ